MSRLRLRLAQNRGFVGACLLLAGLYLAYNLLHPRGFSAAVLVQNAGVDRGEISGNGLAAPIAKRVMEAVLGR